MHISLLTIQSCSSLLQHEVEYAQFLIEEFDSGMSKYLKTGHTKRSYLSDKLICAPMRVSKKFPGKSIGKTNFSRTLKGPDGNPLPDVILESYEIRHKALRIKFLRKILVAEIKVSCSNFSNRCVLLHEAPVTDIRVFCNTFCRLYWIPKRQCLK